MRYPSSMLLFIVGALGCGAPTAAIGVGGDSTSCLDIAQEYADAMKTANLCDPAAADPCGAQRPVVTYLLTEGSAAPQLEGLCVVANAGYVAPTAAPQLDEILVRYREAGCTVGACPGPAPHEPTCIVNGSDPPFCG